VFVWSKSRLERNPPAVFQSLVSARCLRGRACQGRGRTTRLVFALPGASGSTSTLLFRGAGEQQQSTRRSRGGRSREDGAGYAAVPPQTTGGQRRADGCSPQTEPVFGVDRHCYWYMVAKVGARLNLKKTSVPTQFCHSYLVHNTVFKNNTQIHTIMNDQLESALYVFDFHLGNKHTCMCGCT